MARPSAAAIEAVRAGIGVTIMPCYRCDPIPDLESLEPPLPFLTMELWTRRPRPSSASATTVAR